MPYVEFWADEAARKKKAASKTRYTCPACGLNAWAKPEIHIVCGDCDERMNAETPGRGGERGLAQPPVFHPSILAASTDDAGEEPPRVSSTARSAARKFLSLTVSHQE